MLVAALVVIAASIPLAQGTQVGDRLLSLFFAAQLWLPSLATFEQFLIVVVAAVLLALALVVLGCVGVVAALSVRHRKQLTRLAASNREVSFRTDQHSRQYEQLLTLGQSLVTQLDKRVLVQHIVEAASRMTSVPKANAIASLWLLHFETETFRFEHGLYCDETLFAKPAFLPTELPFSRIMTTQQPWLSPVEEDDGVLIRPEKVSQLAAATGRILVPLVIEHNVMGALVLFCHPDALQQYEAQPRYYEALWAELALALAIAIQGEVAILDRLTGVHNREYFMKRLVQEVERANRYQLPLSLLMIDIDNFKQVNDTLGHPQGDAVLKIISKIIKKAVRAIDLVGRYGGEEFAVMLPETGYGDDVTATGGAPVVAERIRKMVEDEFHGLQKPLNLTISIGVACRKFPEHREWDYQELIRHADDQLLRAKTTGKNKVCLLLPDKSQAVS